MARSDRCSVHKRMVRLKSEEDLTKYCIGCLQTLIDIYRLAVLCQNEDD
jgi:hypothetical protein